jgi:hypothetical protein
MAERFPFSDLTCLADTDAANAMDNKLILADASLMESLYLAEATEGVS